MGWHQSTEGIARTTASAEIQVLALQTSHARPLRPGIPRDGMPGVGQEETLTYARFVVINIINSIPQ